MDGGSGSLRSPRCWGFTWCRRGSVPLAKPGPASCGETRTRSSWAETWRRSSSSARVSFSNCASCSLTEARMLAVDSTSESSMGAGCPGWAGWDGGHREAQAEAAWRQARGRKVTQKGRSPSLHCMGFGKEGGRRAVRRD